MKSDSEQVQYPFVSIIIPAFNAEQTIAKCLDSILAQEYRGKYEIIVVDNGSQDRTAEIVNLFDKVNLLKYTDTQSSYAARNKGILASQGNILAFTDADIAVSKAWLRNGIRCFNNKYDCVIAGRVEFVNHGRVNLVGLYDALTAFDQKKYTSHGYSGAGNLFVPRKIFDSVGLFKRVLISGGDATFSFVFKPVQKIFY